MCANQYIRTLTVGLLFMAAIASTAFAAGGADGAWPYQGAAQGRGGYQQPPPQRNGGFKSDVQLRYEEQKRQLQQKAQSQRTQSSAPDLLPNSRSLLDGLYVGGQFGMGMLSSEMTYSDSNDAFDQDGVGGIGYQFNGFMGIGRSNTRNNLYLGGEVDLTLGSVSSETTLNGETINVDVDYSYFLNARAGYLVSPKSMLYLKAGVGMMQWDINSSQGLDGDDKKVGVLAGVGFEHMIRDKISLRTEFSYTVWDKHSNTVGNENIELRPTMMNFYVGASYHF